MKKLIVVICLSVFISSLIPARVCNAGAGWFILGMMVGGAGGDKNTSSGDSSIIFSLDGVAERVKNPLQIRIVSKAFNFAWTDTNLTLEEAFESALKEANRNCDFRKYEILQIVRVFSGSDSQCCALWFAYIEKDKLLSLEAVKEKVNRKNNS